MLLIILGAVVVLFVAIVGWFGVNPPNPTLKPVQKVVPNDKFQVR